MDILVSRTLYMSCQAGPGIEPGPSALKASALPIELTWQTICLNWMFKKYVLSVKAGGIAHLPKFNTVFKCSSHQLIDS